MAKQLKITLKSIIMSKLYNRLSKLQNNDVKPIISETEVGLYIGGYALEQHKNLKAAMHEIPNCDYTHILTFI